ncbi:LysR family transcriptional regulator [Noviherbaspirillum cavernae]|uniref:LysR family transcriptional regulator n=1 Tax=Noviherbaspirillum cavernae TaxID=2320862 RepID=A0A418X4M9_9BURK|nr:LysR family transcriptional regulator [Noviherbaspirillum cavernae]RJG07422.1 LysR family transcriptional regulator [Noviherbaspirillum cavernae]
MATLGQIDLNTLVVFDAVVESGGFTAAAERLGIAKAKVSVQIGRLEAALGITLFMRTTRRVSLTDAGRSLHLQCQPLLHGMQDAIDQVESGTKELAGTLRIGTTVDHAVQSLAAAVAQFTALHPKLQIDVRTGDRVVDLVAEGLDMAIRIGWLRDSSMRAVMLGEFEQYVVASPDYLRRAGRIRQPGDLRERDWVALTLLQTPLTWRFASRAGDVQTVHVKSRIRVDSPGVLRSMLRHGTGVSVLDQYSVQEDIRAGRLVRLLADWTLPRGGVYAVTPPGKGMNPRARQFIEFYRGLLQMP